MNASPMHEAAVTPTRRPSFESFLHPTEENGHSIQGDWRNDDTTPSSSSRKETQVTAKEQENVIYKVYDNPPFYMLFVYAMQQIFVSVSGVLTTSFLISGYLCAGNHPEVRAELLSLTFFMSGVATLLQNTFGIRLPIIQSASFTFLPPIHAMMRLDYWKCPPDGQELENGEDPWIPRIREIQGNLLLASLVHTAIGSFGLVGLLLRFIGPITIGPTVALIGMGFTEAVTDFTQVHWGVAAFTAAAVLVSALCLGRLQVPVPSYSRARGCHTGRFPVFVVLSVLIGVIFGWILCFVLTTTDLLPSNSTELAYRARTDINLGVISTSSWVSVPYPYHFGTPTFSMAGFFGMLLAIVASVMESIGDYFVAAHVSGVPPPPHHAINRGIAIEGFSSILSSMVGACHATTSYSTNVATIAITKVASRRVFQTAGVILIAFGLFTKFGAIITLIPDPVIGGVSAATMGALAAVGLSSLAMVDMRSSRNIAIVGFVFLIGLGVPRWVNKDPSRIKTGNLIADQFLEILLGTPMFLGCLVAVVLDNIIPGTLEQRGMGWDHGPGRINRSTKAGDKTKSDNNAEVMRTYDLPWVSDFLRRVRCCSFVPFLPSFRSFRPKRYTTVAYTGAAKSDKLMSNESKV